MISSQHKVIETIDIISPVVRDDATKKYLMAAKGNLQHSIGFRFNVDDFEIRDQFSYSNLPYSNCYFEVYRDGKFYFSAILGQETKDIYEATFFVPGGSKGIAPLGATAEIKLQNIDSGELPVQVVKEICSGYGFSVEKTIAITSHFSSIILNLLAILNCSNITYIEHAGPKMLNKKRLKQGKYPIYAYKTLAIKRGDRIVNIDGDDDSEKNGVRIHLRRGHLKRRKTGNFWWQPCVVGDKSLGVVHKDYEVTP